MDRKAYRTVARDELRIYVQFQCQNQCLKSTFVKTVNVLLPPPTAQRIYGIDPPLRHVPRHRPCEHADGERSPVEEERAENDEDGEEALAGTLVSDPGERGALAGQGVHLEWGQRYFCLKCIAFNVRGQHFIVQKGLKNVQLCSTIRT